jgi:hypothetical protein
VEGLLVAGAVIAIVQFLRVRDRLLLPLAFFCACLAGAEGREPWEAARRRFQLASVVSGVTLAAMFLAGSARAERRS